jgi:hypothetical protein
MKVMSPILPHNTANLEIFIRDVSASNPELQTPIRLTNDPGADYAPAWSPIGRQIAFVSTRDGDEEIWIANLDATENAFKDQLQPTRTHDHPIWSPDVSTWHGRLRGWCTEYRCFRPHLPYNPPRTIGGGSWPVWDGTGKTLGHHHGITQSKHTWEVIIRIISHGITNDPLNHSVGGITWMNPAFSTSA